MKTHEHTGDILNGMREPTWIVPQEYIDSVKENGQLKEKIVQLETLYAGARDRIADLEARAAMHQITMKQLEEENAKLREGLAELKTTFAGRLL